MKPPRRKHTNRKYTSLTRGSEERRVNPWLSLAQGIVLQAIFDWRMLEAGAKDVRAGAMNYSSLRSFFRSQWAEHLLLCTDLSPLYILEILDRELADVESGYAQTRKCINARPTVVRVTKKRGGAQ